MIQLQMKSGPVYWIMVLFALTGTVLNALDLI